MSEPAYSLAVRRDFQARHYLVGGDWGPENELHTHDYRLELELAGRELNQHGFLVDLVQVEKLVDETLREYQGQTLNDRPAFAGLNPSIEHFSRILCKAFGELLTEAAIQSITVRLWEDESAWASFLSIRK
ncbi:MAG: 6-pyruvoyl tetrahydropterin synthase family protein [Anaerolineales bacterium]